MGMLDDAVDKASDALDDLTGGQETSQAEATAEFVKDVQITPDEKNQGGSAAPDPTGSGKPVSFDFGIPIEFIHFGKVHADLGKKFPHDSFDPEAEEEAPDGHAIMFRDALVREAISLFAFVSSTKVTVQETNSSKGALSDVADMAGDLMGGGSSTPAPDPAQLDTFLADIKTVVESINVDSIKYPDIHAAGKKLHETRATYVAFCESLNDFYIKPPDGALDQVGGLVANVPGVGKIMGTVQRFAFKMQDLYLAAYLEIRKAHEKSVEDAAHDLTVQAIKGKYEKHELIYPVWFKKREKAADSNDDGDDDNLLKPVTEKVDKVKDDIAKEVDKVYDFLGVNGGPDKTPGSPALSAIFGSMAGGTQTTPNAVPGASACINAGLDAAMADIAGVPNFVKKVIGKVNDANLALLQELYARMMAEGIKGEINSLAVYQASRRGLTQHLFSIMTDLVSGLLPADDLGMELPGGKKLSAKQFAAKLVEENLAQYADPIIKIAIGELAGQMEASRKKAGDNDAQTMEVLVARLPWFTALMFRNIFFPMWNIVVEKVFEKIAPEVAKVVKEINKNLDKAKDTVDKVDDYSNRVEDVQDQAAAGVDSVDDIQNIKDSAKNKSPEAIAREKERKDADDKKKNLDKFYTDNDKDGQFPVTSRVKTGSGVKVTEEIESVLPTEDNPMPGQSTQPDSGTGAQPQE
ncbi:MAG: hypothetical protein R2681_17485 [Pyrinomonadaceae bacterium]